MVGKPVTKPSGNRSVSGPIRPMVINSPPDLCKRWRNKKRQNQWAVESNVSDGARKSAKVRSARQTNTKRQNTLGRVTDPDRWQTHTPPMAGRNVQLHRDLKVHSLVPIFPQDRVVTQKMSLEEHDLKQPQCHSVTGSLPAPQKAAPPESNEGGTLEQPTLFGSPSHARTVGLHQSHQPLLPTLEKSEGQVGEAPFYSTKKCNNMKS